MKETEYASALIVRTEIERVSEMQTALAAELAAVSLRLSGLHQTLEHGPAPITATVHTGFYEYRDDGYTSGHSLSRTYPPKVLEVTANHLATVYLAALTQQGSPIPKEFPEHNNIYGTASFSSVALRAVTLDGIEYHERELNLSPLFDAVKPGAFEVVKVLRDEVDATNPYRSIPIPIDRQKLHDVLLRTALLKYCETYDEHFHLGAVATT